MSIATGLLVSSLSHAQGAASVPASVSAVCKDGTTFAGIAKSGACSGHKGVKTWLATPQATSTAAMTKPAVSVASQPATPAKAVASAAIVKPIVPAPTGSAGQVWGNAGTKVYHCPSDKYYGKTKDGSYMSEADALAKGYHADHGKACH